MTGVKEGYQVAGLCTMLRQYWRALMQIFHYFQHKSIVQSNLGKV